jgi:hypothetical protein
MAITALSKVNPFWYIPESEREEQRPTRFRLKPLTPSEKESCMEINRDGKLCLPVSAYDRILRIGTVDWENFPDERGVALTFSLSNIDRIPEITRLELAGAILSGSQISEDEAKN